MATTPKAGSSTANVTGTGTKATTSTIKITATSAATLAAAKSAITQATGKAPANTFAVGSSTSVSQSTPGGKFVQGSTTTPALNKSVSSSSPPTNNGISSVLSSQNILGIAALATAGLSVYNKVASGTNLSQSIVNNSNTAASQQSTTQETPAFRTPGAAHVDAAAPAATGGETPTFRTPGAAHVDAAAPAAVTNDRKMNDADYVNNANPAPVTNDRKMNDADYVNNANPAPVTNDRKQNDADYVNNANAPPVNDRKQNDADYVNNANTAPVDPRTTPGTPPPPVVDKIENATTSTNNVQDPAQRAQAREIVENATPTTVANDRKMNDADYVNNANPAPVTNDRKMNDADYVNNADPAPVVNDRKQNDADYVNNAGPVDIGSQSLLGNNDRKQNDADYIQNLNPDPVKNDRKMNDADYVNNANPEPVVNDRKMNDADYVNNADPAPVVNDRKMNDAEYIQNLNAPPVNDRKQNDAEYIQNLNPEPVNDRKQNDAEYIQNLNPAEVSGDPPIDRKMADADYTNNLIPTSGERGPQGLTAAKLDAQSQATKQDVTNAKSKEDWRVRLSLAPGAKQSKYLYWADPPGILSPLQATNGVIFPYTPSISVAYAATYDNTPLTHSNYKFSTYKSSSVDTITISCDFTAQDTFEAMYVLAVIHFFRSATKMFYGQDENPKLGTPPPLCYLTGLGQFQFDTHPLAITGFTYNLPVDVDYIRAGSTDTPAGVSRANNPAVAKPNGTPQSGASRLSSTGLNPGAVAPPPAWASTNFGTVEPTYVPTKINLSITAVPIITRSDISNVFSLKKYATGELLRGNKRSGGGIW
jgi:ligand-binding sensor protein